MFGSKPALNSKGLRHRRYRSILGNGGLQASPEFKGIKTLVDGRGDAAMGSKPALNSKGLRLFSQLKGDDHFVLQASPEFKGIKT